MELDTQPHKWLKGNEKREKIMPIVDGEKKKGFINPLAYETQIVKRLNSLQPY